MKIKELKDWVIRQREVLKLANKDFFNDIGETKQDWLEQELLTLFDMIAELKGETKWNIAP